MLITTAAITCCDSAEAKARLPIEFRFGWETVIENVADVAPKSTLGNMKGGKKLSIARKWNQLWFGVPIWTSGREFLLCETGPHNGRASQYHSIRDQSTESVAELAGIPKDRLSFPFYAYVPLGWIILVFIGVLVKVTSGPSPQKRFTKLMSDERYRQALEFLTAERSTDADSETDETATPEPEADQRFSDAVRHLIVQGVSRFKATRNLEFIIGYLQSQS